MLVTLFLILASAVNAATVIDSGSPFDSGFTGGTALTITNPISGLQDTTTRYGDFRYNIPCAIGPYFITFRFVETAVNGKGQRVFSIRVNQQLTFDQLDLWATAGRNPFSRTVIAYCSEGSFNIQFATIVRSATVSAIEIEPMELTTYIKPSDPQTVRVTDAVPVWMQDAYYVPRPAIEPDPTVAFVYQNVEVYRNGVRQRSSSQSAAGADYSVTSAMVQLKVMPVTGQPWPATDTVIVDYLAIFPPAAQPLPPDPPQ